jgi:hypothetical protein
VKALIIVLALTTTACIGALALLSSPGATGAAPDLARTRTATPTRTPTVTPTPVPQPVAAQGPGIMTAYCTSTSPTSVRAVFLWTPSRAGAQYLDLSIFNDGFAPGTFVGLGPFDKHGWGWSWDGLLQGTTHFARINTLTSAGWKASETLAFYTPVCDAGALTPPPGNDMLTLRSRIESAIAGSGINAAVAITDLRTGESIDVYGDDVRLPGCTINLFALARVVQDLQFGKYAEPQPGDLIWQTINRSDPITSRMLVRYWIGNGDLYAGLAETQEFIASLGMSSTLLDHPPAFPSETLYGAGDNRITANDANRGLRAIWDGRVLTPGWRDYLLEKMTHVKPGLNYLIPAGVGYDATVSHKNGFLYAEGWADNDIGIVWFERGGQRFGYAISFFTEGVATKYADIPLGQSISSMSWQWFVGRYGYP